jgi:hypothetical protein
VKGLLNIFLILSPKNAMTTMRIDPERPLTLYANALPTAKGGLY